MIVYTLSLNIHIHIRQCNQHANKIATPQVHKSYNYTSTYFLKVVCMMYCCLFLLMLLVCMCCSVLLISCFIWVVLLLFMWLMCGVCCIALCVVCVGYGVVFVSMVYVVVISIISFELFKCLFVHTIGLNRYIHIQQCNQHTLNWTTSPLHQLYYYTATHVCGCCICVVLWFVCFNVVWLYVCIIAVV